MDARPSSPRSRPLVGWVGLGLALVALHSIWSVSIPLMAAPDEPSHVIHAAAVVRGQWSGTLGAAPTSPSAIGAATTVELPSDYAAASTLQTCFAFHSNQPASCQPTLPAPKGTVAVDTFAGQYPPLYYALVGWPSWFLSAGASTYAMRILSGIIASTLLVWGLFRLRSATLRAPWTWAAIAAITPMTLFMGAMVNPQALEISSAFAFWAACLALARSPRPPGGGAVVQATVAGALLINSRTSGPVWALAIVVVALVLAPKERLRELWQLRSMRWALGIAVAAGAAAAAWLLNHPAVVTEKDLFPKYANPFRVAASVLVRNYGYLHQMVGNFGWLDAPSPGPTILSWTLLVGMLLVVALAAGASRRVRAALLLAVLAVLFVPVVLQVPTAVDTGIIWQGRYSLPAAVGVPMIAAIALTTAARPVDELVRRIVRWAVIPLAVAAHVLAFWWAMRRYSVGIKGSLLTLSPEWSSPLGYLSAVALYGLVVAGIAAVAWYSLRPRTAKVLDVDVDRELALERLAQPVV